MSLFSWLEKESGPGSMVSANGDPSKVEGAKIEPKPADFEFFIFGWACAKGHVSGPFTACLETNNEIRICQTCGDLPLKKAVVKRTGVHYWKTGPYFGHWSTEYGGEVVRFVDDKKPRPRRRKK